ncbi:MAG: hypothetical protein JO144_00660, partial [Actinobacteria bacterium]|nr:hypothetical protein [Actinomycetota bacterium]
PLRPDRGYFNSQPGSLVISTPCGPQQWCVSTDMHQRLIDESGGHPARLSERLLAEDPHLGQALRVGRRVSRLGGAGKLRMQRRPMTGPGWCLVGDAGYHLDPVTARGTKAALVTARILRDRIAELGTVDGARLGGLTEQRDAALEADWQVAAHLCQPATVAS